MIKLMYLFNQKQIFQSFIFNNNLDKYELINEELKNYIDNIANINTNKLNLDSLNLNNKIETKILFGIKLPFIQNIINENIFTFIKNNISKKYILAEYIIMNKRISLENIDLEKSKYLNEIKQLNNILINELINYPLLINILKSGEKQLIKDLFNDCFHIYLMKSNIFYDDYDSLIEILDIIIQLRLKTRINDDLNIDFYLDTNKEIIELLPSFLDLFKNNKQNSPKKNIILNNNEEKDNDIIEFEDYKDENFYLDIFANVLNFIESYSKEIYNILEIFYFLRKKTGNKDCINEVKSIIINKKITMEISDRTPEYSQINKICFFFIIESLLKQTINNLKNHDFIYIYNFLKKLKCYMSNILQIENKLLLFSKALFTFEIIIKIIEYYDQQLIESKEEIKIKEYETVIKTIIEDEELLLSKKYDEFNNNLKIINNHLKTIFEKNSDKYAKLMTSIINNRYKSINNNNCRENMIKLLIPNELGLFDIKLIENSYPLICLILGKSEPEICVDDKNQEKYKKKFLFFVDNIDKNFSLKKILNGDYPRLNEVIIYYYENCCQNYFDKIENEEKDKEKLCQKICGGMSKIYLILAINFIKDNFEKQNLNNTSLNILGKLYSIAYIKIYLKHYVDTLMNNNYQNLPERKEINQILFSEETIIAKEIKYYTLKLYLRKKNYEELLQNIKEDNAFEFKEYFQNIELKDSKIFFYSLLPTLNETNFIKYKEFYDTNFKEQQNQNEEKDLSLPKEIKKCKINDIIYTYLYFDFSFKNTR